MEQNPYAAPTAETRNDSYYGGKKSSVEAPEEILKDIKNGWVAAVISGVMTLVVTLVAMNTELMGGLIDQWMLIDVVLIFALAWGIYRRSRFAATSMFIYFLGSKIWIFAETGRFQGGIIAIVFLYYYGKAMKATYDYHAL